MTNTVMTTCTGHEVDLGLPMLTDAISATCVSHHLALINRFTGAASRPYSVAEHSLLVCDIAERELRLDLHGQLAALLHDAHEAFVGDVSTPLKRALAESGVAYGHLEDRWQYFFQRSFGVLVASRIYEKAVRRADLIALATERRDLMPGDLAEWPALHGIEPVTWIDLRHSDVPWCEWRNRFLARLNALDSQREAIARAIPKGPLK